MDFRSLQCFIAVAEELNFRRAAVRLNLTQPSLSQRIQTLELEVGTPLFTRDRRKVALTEAGSAFLDPARQSLAQGNRAIQQANAAARGETGRLRLGFTVIAFYNRLPEAVRLFRTAYPEVAIELVEVNSPGIEAGLSAGSLDLGVLHPPVTTPGISLLDLPPEPMMLALPSEHPLASRERLKLTDLRDQPLLAAPRAIGPSFYDRLITHLRAAGVAPMIVQEVTPMPSLLGLVGAGVGMGFVTAGLASAGRPGVVFRDVEDFSVQLPLSVGWLGDAPTASGARFLEVALKLFTSEKTDISRDQPAPRDDNENA